MKKQKKTKTEKRYGALCGQTNRTPQLLLIAPARQRA